MYRPTCPGLAGVPPVPAMKIRSPGSIAAVEVTGAPANTCWKVVRGSGTPAAPQARIVSPEQSHPPGSAPPHRYGWPSWARANATTVLCWVTVGRPKPGGSVVNPPPLVPSPLTLSPPSPGQSETDPAGRDEPTGDVDGGVELPMFPGQ